MLVFYSILFLQLVHHFTTWALNSITEPYKDLCTCSHSAKPLLTYVLIHLDLVSNELNNTARTLFFLI